MDASAATASLNGMQLVRNRFKVVYGDTVPMIEEMGVRKSCGSGLEEKLGSVPNQKEVDDCLDMAAPNVMRKIRAKMRQNADSCVAQVKAKQSETPKAPEGAKSNAIQSACNQVSFGIQARRSGELNNSDFEKECMVEYLKDPKNDPNDAAKAIKFAQDRKEAMGSRWQLWKIGVTSAEKLWNKCGEVYTWSNSSDDTGPTVDYRSRDLCNQNYAGDITDEDAVNAYIGHLTKDASPAEDPKAYLQDRCADTFARWRTGSSIEVEKAAVKACLEECAPTVQ